MKKNNRIYALLYRNIVEHIILKQGFEVRNRFFKIILNAEKRRKKMKAFYNIEELAYILNTNRSRLYKARGKGVNDPFATKYVAITPRNTTYPCEAVIETLIRLGNDREKAIDILNSLDSKFMGK